MTLTAQALVIGGGVAGGAIAAHLACAGRDVILIERKAGAHDKVCGEFVSGEAVRYLRGLGIDLLALGAVPILTVNINTPRRRVGCDLPFPAVSISRRALDEAILSRASICGTAVRRGRGVKLLRRRADRWVAELDGGSKVAAADVFLTTGKHDLREWKRSSGHQNDLIAFKLHWRPAAGQITALGSCVELERPSLCRGARRSGSRLYAVHSKPYTYSQRPRQIGAECQTWVRHWCNPPRAESGIRCVHGRGKARRGRSTPPGLKRR